MSVFERDPTTGNFANIAGTMSIDNFKNLLLDMVYPIGSVYMSSYNVSPASFLGGTWTQLSGYMLRAANSGVTPNNNAKDGGADTVTLAETQIPSHRHQVSITNGYSSGFPRGGNYTGSADWTDIWTTYTGGGQAHNNLPNYKNVYMWERTA